MNSIESHQKINDNFKIQGMKYSQDEKDLANIRFQLQVLMLHALTSYHAYVI